MAWIKTVSDEEATGLLEKIYADARGRAGRVFNILRVQSLNPKVMRAGISLYAETTVRESSISRALREMIGTVVSSINECHY